MERVLPWGMPCVMILIVECACWVCVDCCLLWKYDAKKATVSGVKLNVCLSLCRSLVCETVSYAFDRSMYMARVGCFRFISAWSLSMTVWSARVVLELGLNAYWVGEIMLYFVRCVISWVLTRVSRSLAMMGRREIGL